MDVRVCRKTVLVPKSWMPAEPGDKLFMAIFKRHAGKVWWSVPLCPSAVEMFGLVVEEGRLDELEKSEQR